MLLEIYIVYYYYYYYYQFLNLQKRELGGCHVSTFSKYHRTYKILEYLYEMPPLHENHTKTTHFDPFTFQTSDCSLFKMFFYFKIY